MRYTFKYIPLALAMLLLASSFSATFVQIAFQVNRNYIVKELCINRTKPQLRCNGKCYLKKQLERQAEKQSPVPSQQIQHETFTWLFTGDVVVYFDNPAQKNKPVTSFTDFLSIGHILSVDHPPPFAA